MPTSMRTDSHTDAEPAADTDAKSKAQADADTADCSLCHHNETMRHWLCKQKVHLDSVMEARAPALLRNHV